MKKILLMLLVLVLTVTAHVANKPVSAAKEAKIYIACDDQYILWLNGTQLGSDKYTPEKPNVYKVKLSEGDVLAIAASDNEVGRRSAGLYCCIVLVKDKKSYGTNKKWRCSTKKQKDGWLTNDKKLYAGSSVSERNVHGDLLTKAERYQAIDPLLKGTFIWSKKNSPVVYLKVIIDFKSFK